MTVYWVPAFAGMTVFFYENYIDVTFSISIWLASELTVYFDDSENKKAREVIPGFKELIKKY